MSLDDQELALASVDGVNAMRDVMETLHKPTIEKLQIPSPVGEGTTEIPVAFVPKGMDIKALNEFLTPYKKHPDRRTGMAVMTDLQSFISLATRFKAEGSALFARENQTRPALFCVFDYHDQGAGSAANWLEHTARYDFPLSPEWEAWIKQNGTPMEQADFAAFLEDRIVDVLGAPDVAGEPEPSELIQKLTLAVNTTWASPSKLMEISRGLAVSADEKIESAVKLQSGEAEVKFSSEHKDNTGAPIKVPGLFMIGIPVFLQGTIYQIGVRLRYRLQAGSIVWFYELYRTDLVFTDAFREACDKAATDTEIPLFYGAAEKGTNS